jgi:hypothetical protein
MYIAHSSIPPSRPGYFEKNIKGLEKVGKWSEKKREE